MNSILIHKGDCTVFADCNRFLAFNIETDLDLTGWQAKFILGWITKEIEDISSKSFEIVLSADETKQLRLGSQCGSIILTDAEGHIKTVANNIPFEVTTAVVENEYQEIDLTIPQSSGVDILLTVGAKRVTSVNGMTGDVNLTIPSIEGLATEQQLAQGLNAKQDKGNYALKEEIPSIEGLATEKQLTDGLNTKQPKGNYALVDDIPTQVSELENDSQFATQTQVLQAIASIPQFKMSIVNELPSTGEKMTLYLVPKEGTNNDVYDEYIWIEQTSSFEHLGTTAVDLTDYVKNTDYATSDKGGVVKVGSTNGLTIYNGLLIGVEKPLSFYTPVANNFIICKGTLENIKNDLVKRAVTANDVELTDEEKTNARTWLGAVGSTDYATNEKAGVVKISSGDGLYASPTGRVSGVVISLDKYSNVSDYHVISKGILGNVLT